jgi:hypothetical protein
MNHDLLPDLLIAIEQQLLSPQTPYVRKTLDRLVKSGLGEDEAKTQMAIALGEQMDEVLRTKKPFDEKAYRAGLEELPFAEEEDDEDEGGEEE